PRVHALLLARYEAAGRPEDGWVFPNRENNGHVTDGLTKEQHRKALNGSRVSPFVPYEMRHTSLTRFGEAAGGNVFLVAQIAGHASLTTTKRYVHPQGEAHQKFVPGIAKAVGERLGGSKSPHDRRWAQNWAHPKYA